MLTAGATALRDQGPVWLPVIIAVATTLSAGVDKARTSKREKRQPELSKAATAFGDLDTNTANLIDTWGFAVRAGNWKEKEAIDELGKTRQRLTELLNTYAPLNLALKALPREGPRSGTGLPTGGFDTLPGLSPNDRVWRGGERDDPWTETIGRGTGTGLSTNDAPRGKPNQNGGDGDDPWTGTIGRGTGTGLSTSDAPSRERHRTS